MNTTTGTQWTCSKESLDVNLLEAWDKFAKARKTHVYRALKSWYMKTQIYYIYSCGLKPKGVTYIHLRHYLTKNQLILTLILKSTLQQILNPISARLKFNNKIQGKK
jgi:hypothetical protein